MPVDIMCDQIHSLGTYFVDERVFLVLQTIWFALKFYAVYAKISQAVNTYLVFCRRQFLFSVLTPYKTFIQP